MGGRCDHDEAVIEVVDDVVDEDNGDLDKTEQRIGETRADDADGNDNDDDDAAALTGSFCNAFVIVVNEQGE